MNKLVSKNPVLRFKLGRKIVKADWGWKSIYTSDGKIDINKVLHGKAQEGRIGMNGKPIIDNYYTQKPAEQQKTSSTDYSWMTRGTRQNTLEQLKKLDAEALRLKNLQNSAKFKLSSKKNTPPIRSIIDNKYLKGYEGMQQEIAGLGGVRKVLEMLGFTKDNGLDGIWGENTQKAFDAWKAKQQNDYILQLVLNNIPLLPVDLSNSAALPTIQEQMSALTNNFTLTPQTTIKQPLPSLNRSDTRWVINDALGKNAYNYTGSLRKALRLYLNGEKYNANDLAAFGNLDIFDKYKTTSLKQGGNMILPSRNIVERFKQGRKIELFLSGGINKKRTTPIKRFTLAASDNSFTKEFDTEELAKAYRKQHNIVGRITDNSTSARGLVIKADRTTGKDARATAYGRLQAEKNNNLSFKQAYQTARKEGNKYFAYKGKVYKSDLQNGKDNMADMQMLYGTHLGYSKDPKLLTSTSRAAREQYRKDTKASNTNRNANYKGETNSQANARADKNFNRKLGVSTLAPDFIDAVSPQTAIGNFMNMAGSAMTGEHFTPRIYLNGFNVPGYASDLVQGKYKDLAFRGLDAWLSTGAPGARINMTPGGTNVTEGATLLPNGTRTFSKWHLNSLGPNAEKIGENILRSKKGTLYFIDNGQYMKNLTIPAILSNPIILQIQNLEK